MAMNSNFNLIEKLRRDMLKNRQLERALLEVPREFFVPEEYRKEAYVDCSIPIGHEQYICKPSSVVLMTELADVKKGQKVLEIGTGSGWHTCLLSRMVGESGKVFTIEICEPLIDFARKSIRKNGLGNITIIHGDGTLGIKEKGPFDRILVTAAAPEIPKPLEEQLKKRGKVVAPVGNLYTQQIIQYEKTRELNERQTEGYFRIDPLRGRYGFRGWW